MTFANKLLIFVLTLPYIVECGHSDGGTELIEEIIYTPNGTEIIWVTEAYAEDIPLIDGQWIQSMVFLGFLGWIGIALASFFGGINFYMLRDTSQSTSPLFVILAVTMWICNLIACVFWCFFRTDLMFKDVFSDTYCQWIYLLNFILYLCGKYCLHILLIYRLHIVLGKSTHRYSNRFLQIFVGFITVNFLLAMSLWINRVAGRIHIGITTDNWYICTLYNSATKMDTESKIYPIYFGFQDLMVGAATMLIFLFKLKQLFTTQTDNHKHAHIRDVMVKLSVLGSISIVSTFIFYTFAVPFYPDFTFLLPADALINSICILLMCSFCDDLYVCLCCACDGSVRLVLQIEPRDSSFQASGGDPHQPQTTVITTIDATNTEYTKDMESRDVTVMKGAPEPIELEHVSVTNNPSHEVMAADMMDGSGVSNEYTTGSAAGDSSNAVSGKSSKSQPKPSGGGNNLNLGHQLVAGFTSDSQADNPTHPTTHTHQSRTNRDDMTTTYDDSWI